MSNSSLARRWVIAQVIFLLLVSTAHAAILLQNNVAVRNLKDASDSHTFYRITVPPGAMLLTVRLNGGRGDADLYLQYGAEPTFFDYDKRSIANGNHELIASPMPAPGDWFIMIDAASAYSGATLLASFTMGPGTVAPPVILPAEGIFPGKAAVQLRARTGGTIMRYTLDGSDPDATSFLYSRSITVTQTTLLNARAFKGSSTPSATASAVVTVLPENAVTELTPGEAVTNLAGSGLSRAYFHVAVSTNQARLNFQNLNAGGATELFARFGGLPEDNLFDAHCRIGPRRDTLTLTNPAAGDWFVLLRGRRDFSGASLEADFRLRGPDLIPWAPVLQPRIETNTFQTNDCNVIEGLVQAGTRRLLRFTTETRNIGEEDVKLGSPVGNPLFEFAPCHGHYHFIGYAAYRLLGTNDAVVATGAKVGFCLEDVYRWDTEANNNFKYTCDNQGIQSGWSDVYSESLPGQWIDITEVPAGDYTLEITVNWLQKIAESDYSNNTIRVPVAIP